MVLFKKCFAIPASVFAMATLLACGDDVTNNVYQMGMQVTNVMGDCGSKNRGEIIYVTDSNAVYVCGEKGWEQSAGGLVDKDTVYSIDTVYSKDTVFFVTRDTLVKKDTVVVNQKDTVVVSKKDTLVVRDTVEVHRIDTLVVVGSSNSGGSSNGFVSSDTITTAYLNQEMLAAGDYGFMNDPRDGHVYRTIKIGENTWTAQNMNYHGVGGLCYNDDDINCEHYGRLYEIGAISKACPSGWHAPTSAEYQQMYNDAGATDAAVYSEFEGGNNSSGFSILKGGERVRLAYIEYIYTGMGSTAALMAQGGCVASTGKYCTTSESYNSYRSGYARCVKDSDSE